LFSVVDALYSVYVGSNNRGHVLHTYINEFELKHSALGIFSEII